MMKFVVLVVFATLIHESIAAKHAMLGVGLDNSLYTRTVRNGAWKAAAGDSCCVISVAEMPDGSLLGVGDDNQLYTKLKPGVGAWEGPLPRSCCLLDVAVMEDGTIIGVNMKRKLVVREGGLDGDWVIVENGCCIKDVAVLPDGRLLGLAKNGNLNIREGLEGQWSYFKSVGPKMDAISAEPSGTIYGIHRDTCEMHILGEDGVWEEPSIPNSDCMIDMYSTGELTPPKF